MPRSAQFNKQALAALAAKQHSVVTRAQALQSGMTERVLDYRIRGAGPWQVLLPSVYLTRAGRPGGVRLQKGRMRRKRLLGRAGFAGGWAGVVRERIGEAGGVRGRMG